MINQSICFLPVPDWIIIPGTTHPPILLLAMVRVLHYCTLVYHMYILQTFSTYTYNIDSTAQQGMRLYRYMLIDTLATLGS